MGRKRRDDRSSVRREVVPVRLTTEERGALQVAAGRRGETESAFAREVILRELRRAGDLRTSTVVVPVGADRVIAEAEAAFGESVDEKAPARRPQRKRRRRT